MCRRKARVSICKAFMLRHLAVSGTAIRMGGGLTRDGSALQASFRQTTDPIVLQPAMHATGCIGTCMVVASM